MDTTQPARSAISIVVTRADGTVEDLGVVSFESRNLLERLAYAAKKRLGHRVDTTEVITPDAREETE